MRGVSRAWQLSESEREARAVRGPSLGQCEGSLEVCVLRDVLCKGTETGTLHLKTQVLSENFQREDAWIQSSPQLLGWQEDDA